MKTRQSLSHLAIVTLIALGASAPSLADNAWGVRVGISDDPDQIVGGVDWDLGTIVDRWRWQPSVEIGFGDDVKTAAGNLLAAYRFRPQRDFAPYLGAQLSAVYYDIDNGGNETEIGPAFVAGFDTPLSSNRRFRLELQLGFGDIPDAKVMAGWSFD